MNKRNFSRSFNGRPRMDLRLLVEPCGGRLEDTVADAYKSSPPARETEARIDDKGIGAMSSCRLCSLTGGLMVGGANAWASKSCWDACCDRDEKSCKGSMVENCGMSGQEFDS